MTKNEDLKPLLPCDFPNAIKRRKHLMHVYDAGHNPKIVAMRCGNCGHTTGWEFHPDKTITELKRGIPCPKCN